MKRATSPARPLDLAAAAAVLTALLFAAGPAHAVGEQVGRIKGRVTDASSGAALPAVTVVARSAALIGGPRSVLSDEQGRYELTDLPPGSYTVEFSYAGANPITRNAQVRQGEAAAVNLSWTPEQTGTENVSLRDTAPSTQPDSAQTGAIVGADTLRRIPIGRSYQSAAQLVPGVSGRTNGSAGSNPNIRGGLEIHNRYLVDGLDITDPVTGTFSANMSFESIGSVQVLTGGMEAQYNSLGGVINVISSGGSDEFHANVTFVANHEKLSASSGTFGPALYDDRQPFNSNPVGPNQSYQMSVSAGGPIIHNRLWYNAAYDLRLIKISPVNAEPLGVPPYNIQHAAENDALHLLRFKLSWAPSTRHRLTLSANADPAVFNNVTDDAAPNSLLGVAEQRQNQGGGFLIAHWDWFLDEALTLNVQAGLQLNTIENGPQGRLGSIDLAGCNQFKRMDNCHYDPNRPQHQNVVDATVWYQGAAYDNDSRTNVQIDPSLSLHHKGFGTHDAKVGIQTRYNYRSQHRERPGGSVFLDNSADGLGLEEGLCDPTSPDGAGCFRRIDYQPYDVKEKAYSLGFYLQDRWWTPAAWLTVVPGLRIDYGHTADRHGKTISNLWGLGPRLALVADVTGDGRNVISVAYGRANEVLSLLPAANIDSTEAAVTVTHEWDQSKRDFVREVSRSGGPGGIVVDQNLSAPHSDEITINARRQIFTDTVAGIDYTWKRISNVWDQIEINQIWDPSGQRVVDYVVPDMKQAIYRYATPADNHRTHQGIDLYLEGRPSLNWDFAASYTLAWLYGPGVSEFDQISAISQSQNPRNRRYFDGFLPEDVRHIIKAYGGYQIGPVNIGANLRYETGVPRTKRFFTAQDGDYTRYRSPLGTEPGNGNDLQQISEFRLPDFLKADLRFMVNVLPRRLGQKLDLIADIFNVFGTRYPTSVATTDTATFGRVAARQTPLRVQLSLNYLY